MCNWRMDQSEFSVARGAMAVGEGDSGRRRKERGDVALRPPSGIWDSRSPPCFRRPAVVLLHGSFPCLGPVLVPLRLIPGPARSQLLDEMMVDDGSALLLR